MVLPDRLGAWSMLPNQRHRRYCFNYGGGYSVLLKERPPMSISGHWLPHGAVVLPDSSLRASCPSRQQFESQCSFLTVLCHERTLRFRRCQEGSLAVLFHDTVLSGRTTVRWGGSLPRVLSVTFPPGNKNNAQHIVIRALGGILYSVLQYQE